MTIQPYDGLPIRRFTSLTPPVRAAAVVGVIALALASTFVRTWYLGAAGWLLTLAAAAWLAHIPSRKRSGASFAVVDIETTGLDRETNRIIEVSIVHTDGNGALSEPISWLVRPDDGSFGGEDIHHISKADLADAPTFNDVAHEIIASINGRALVAHNAGFDWGFLEAELDRTSGGRQSCTPVAVVCTARLAKTAGLRPLKLASVCEQLRVDGPTNAHRAADDALACARTLAPLLDRLGVADTSRF